MLKPCKEDRSSDWHWTGISWDTGTLMRPSDPQTWWGWDIPLWRNQSTSVRQMGRLIGHIYITQLNGIGHRSFTVCTENLVVLFHLEQAGAPTNGVCTLCGHQHGAGVAPKGQPPGCSRLEGSGWTWAVACLGVTQNLAFQQLNYFGQRTGLAWLYWLQLGRWLNWSCLRSLLRPRCCTDMALYVLLSISRTKLRSQW